MLELFLRREFEAKKPQVEASIDSAGILNKVARPPHEHSVEAMRRHGFDLAPHRSQWINELDLNWFDHILCFESEMVEALVANKAPRDKIRVIEKSPTDPRYQDLDAHFICAGVLATLAKEIVEALTT